MNLHLIHAGRYTHKQIHTQITQAAFLNLNISGLNYSHTFTPDNRPWLDGLPNSISLLPPGFRMDFSYQANRENFVLICDIPGLNYDYPEKLLKLPYSDSVLNLQPQRKLTVEQCNTLRNTFEEITALRQSPVPGNLFASEQLTCTLLCELLITPDSPAPDGKNNHCNIAGQFRKQLDSDNTFQYTLGKHCQLMGYSAGYLRKIFTQTYGIDPCEYRMRRKLERIQNLFSSGNMTPKEVADAVGMQNVTHLHAFIKQRCGMTPCELLKTLRQ